MRAVLMRGVVVRAGPDLVVLRGRAVLAGGVSLRQRIIRSGVQLAPFGPGQAGHHQLVGMIDLQFILEYTSRPVGRCPSVPLAEVVARDDRAYRDLFEVVVKVWRIFLRWAGAWLACRGVAGRRVGAGLGSGLSEELVSGV